MNLLVSKIIALFGQVVVLLVFVLLPIKVSRWMGENGARGKLALCCLRCFGGGALLGCFMLIQTPEIRLLLTHTLLDPHNISYPVPEALAGVGFFFFLFVERLVALCERRQSKKARIPVTESKVCMLSGGCDGPADEMGGDDGICMELGGSSHGSSHSCLEVGGTNHSLEVGEHLCGGEMGTSPHGFVSPGLPDKEGGLELIRDHDVVVVVETAPEQPSGGAARSILLLIVLSADGLFQGLAIGLKYNTPAVWNLFVAVVGHEFVVAFCLGLELVKHQKLCVVVLSGLLYACTPAVGTAVGIAIFQSSGEAGSTSNIDMINGLLQSVATGVFLYVAFIGILAHELTVNTRMVKLVAVLCGYGLMAGLAILNPPANHGTAPELPNGASSLLAALTTPSPITHGT